MSLALSPATRDAIERWCAQLMALDGASPNTLRAYQADVTAFADFLAGHLGEAVSPRALTSCSQPDLRAFMAHERARGLGARSLARRLSSVKGFVRWLRPEHQAGALQKALPDAAEPEQAEAKPGTTKHRPAKVAALPWPGDLPSRIQALTTLLRAYAKKTDEPIETRFLAMMFKGAKLDDVELTLQCAAAADAVARTENADGEVAWAARAT